MRYLSHILFVILLSCGFTCVAFAQGSRELYKLSVTQTNKGNYSEALTTINKVLSLDSTTVDFMVQKATICFHLNKYDESLRYCYSVLKKEPENPQVLLLRGFISVTTKSYGGALFLFGKVIKVSKDRNYLLQAHFNRGKVLMATEKFTEAIVDLSAADKLQSDSVEILMLLSEALYKVKQMDEALTNALKVVNKQSSFSSVYKLLGRIYVDKKASEKALEAFKTYCDLDPMDASVYLMIAAIHLENKNYDQAQIAVAHATQLNPSDPISYKVLASIYIAKGQKEEGCNSIFRAFQLGYLEKYGYDLMNLYLTNCEGR